MTGVEGIGGAKDTSGANIMIGMAATKNDIRCRRYFSIPISAMAAVDIHMAFLCHRASYFMQHPL